MLGENKEKKIAILAVVVLVATLVLIYIFYFNTKGKKIAENADKLAQQQLTNTGVLNQTGSGIVDDILKGSDTASGKNLTGTQSTGANNTGDKKEEDELAFLDSDSAVTTGSKMLSGNKTQPKEDNTVKTVKPESKTSNDEPKKDIKVLAGTQVYSGKLDLVTELNLKYEYILKDSNDVYFIRLSPSFGNISDSVKKLGGNTVEITDKNIINENMLFGDKVVYINLSKYYKQKVIILSKFNTSNEYWLVQVDFDKYYKLKSYLKSLFIF